MSTPLSARQRRRRDRLVQQAADLVKPIAQAYARQSRECVDDLIQVGLLGVVRATQLYNNRLGVPFAGFARPHVRGAILHYLRDQAPLVRLPRRQQEWRQHLGKGEADSSSHDQRRGEAHQARLATLEQWRAMARPLPLEAIADLDQRRCSRINGSDDDRPGIYGACSYTPRDLSPTWHDVPITRLLSLVDHRKQQVLRRVVLKGWSYRRTGLSLGVSAPTVQRLLHAALSELRQGLTASALSETGQGSRRRDRSAARGC